LHQLELTQNCHQAVILGVYKINSLRVELSALLGRFFIELSFDRFDCMVYRRSYKKYSNRFYWLDRVEGTMGIDEIGMDTPNEFQHIHEQNNVGRLRLIFE